MLPGGTFIHIHRERKTMNSRAREMRFHVSALKGSTEGMDGLSSIEI